MKAWRLEGFAINQQREHELATTGRVTTPKSRVQKNQRQYIERVFKGKQVTGNWFLNGLLAKGGYLPTIKPADMPVHKPPKPTSLATLKPSSIEDEGLVKRGIKALKKLASKFGA